MRESCPAKDEPRSSGVERQVSVGLRLRNRMFEWRCDWCKRESFSRDPWVVRIGHTNETTVHPVPTRTRSHLLTRGAGFSSARRPLHPGGLAKNSTDHLAVDLRRRPHQRLRAGGGARQRLLRRSCRHRRCRRCRSWCAAGRLADHDIYRVSGSAVDDPEHVQDCR